MHLSLSSECDALFTLRYQHSALFVTRPVTGAIFKVFYVNFAMKSFILDTWEQEKSLLFANKHPYT